MNHYDALSYFSDGFLDRVADPDELGRQLYEHRMEPEYIREAIVELARYAQNRARYRRLDASARTMAGETIFELMYTLADEDGRVRRDELVAELRRRHRYAGARNLRVLDKLERGGVLFVERAADAFGRTTYGAVMLRLSPVLRQAPVEHVYTTPLDECPACRQGLSWDGHTQHTPGCPDSPDSPPNLPIEELELGVAAYNVLKRLDVDTFGELVEVTEAELDSWQPKGWHPSPQWRARVREDVREAQERARAAIDTGELVARMAADPWDLEAVRELTPADRDEFGHGLGELDAGEDS